MGAPEESLIGLDGTGELDTSRAPGGGAKAFNIRAASPSARSSGVPADTDKSAVPVPLLVALAEGLTPDP
jgi:hypothetical protein